METLLQKTGVVPVVVLDDADDAVPVARALVEGGLPLIEVTLRTAAAPEAIRRIANEVPDAIIGAGTVLNAEQVDIAATAGAKFIVSPGLHASVVDRSRELGLPIYPGVATPTEALAAINMGLKTLKFFPAGQAGGIPMLKALGSVYRDVKFMPTGGISAANLSDYLQLDSVAACGGSWLTPAAVIKSREFDVISRLATEARDIAKNI